MKIIIESIPHESHRYSTIGDYWWDDNGDLQIRVSNVGNWKYEALVAIHELIEVLLCKDRGIQEPDIMAFDKAFEAARKPGNEDEPGDSMDAPYRKEHRFSENLERLFAAELGVNWADYDNALDAVYLPKP
jgi:hypothetical protein